MTYNEFERKPLRWDQPLYKYQTSGPQCGLSLEVSLYSILHGVFSVFAVRMGNWSGLVVPLQFQVLLLEEILWV